MSDQLSVKGFLPTFNFLGSLVEGVPNVAHILVTQFGETLQQTPSHISHLHSITTYDEPITAVLKDKIQLWWHYCYVGAQVISLLLAFICFFNGKKTGQSSTEVLVLWFTEERVHVS